jgi:hypothetical protein
MALRQRHGTRICLNLPPLYQLYRILDVKELALSGERVKRTDAR